MKSLAHRFSAAAAARLFACAFCVLAASGARGAEDRFSAVLADGTVLSGAEVRGWGDTRAKPELDGRPLLDSSNPARWVLDRTVEPAATPRAFVELWGGDLLPGRVVAYRTGEEQSTPPSRSRSSRSRRAETGMAPAPSAASVQAFPRLVVEPEVPVDFPTTSRRSAVQVFVRAVRRIVWQWRGSDHYQPGTLLYLDGRRLKFRSIRLEQGSARVLLAEGTAEASFGEIAELHFPWVDPWEAYFDALVPLAPRADGLLMQVETAGGLRVTASLERFQARTKSGADDAKSWVHLLQPAWSDEPFWIEHRSIRLRRFFPPDSVPLSLIAPRQTRQESPLGQSWPAQVNRSVRGGPLASGGSEYGWGFGVHARTELEFELPAFARSLRARVGLDRSAGSGGCARALITAGSPRPKPLFRSELLIGSAEVADTGSLALDGAGGPLQVLLVADLAHADRPPGADPLDIRDSVDWLEPEVALDARALRREILRRAPRAIPAWQGFTVEGSEAPVELTNRWEGTDPRTMRARLEVSPLLRYLKLSRQFELEGDERLLLAVGREQGRPPARIQVRVDGRPLGEFEAPERRGGADPPPIVFQLGGGKRRAEVEIFQHMGTSQTSIEWRGITVTRAVPVAPPAPDRRKASR